MRLIYDVEKRYSDFKMLFTNLRDILPVDYKFPNKSIFNNNSSFTKERRVRGFDELLSLLLQMINDEVVYLDLKNFVFLDQQIEKNRKQMLRNLAPNSDNKNNHNNHNPNSNHQRSLSSSIDQATTNYSIYSPNLLPSGHNSSELLSGMMSTPNNSNHPPNSNNTNNTNMKQRAISHQTQEEMRIRKSMQQVSYFLRYKQQAAELHLLSNPPIAMALPTSTTTTTPTTTGNNSKVPPSSSSSLVVAGVVGSTSSGIIVDHNNEKISTSPIDTLPTSTTISPSSSSSVAIDKVGGGSSITTSSSSSTSSSTAIIPNKTIFVDIDACVRADMKQYIIYSVQIACMIYLTVILLGIVDVSRSHLSEIFFTFLALVLLCLLLKIRYERRKPH
jgi:hypothetical protein